MTDTTTDEQDTTPAPDAEDKRIAEASDDELVAARSADVHEDSSDEHVKVFVHGPGPNPTKGEGFSHEANFAATRQYMMSQGLRPTGDVTFVSVKPHLGDAKRGWDLTYSVPAVPAERFDFDALRGASEQDYVITDNEDPDHDGTVNANKSTNDAGSSDEADKLPTMSDTRQVIDDYGTAHGIDTTGAANKTDALALLTKPSV